MNTFIANPIRTAGLLILLGLSWSPGAPAAHTKGGHANQAQMDAPLPTGVTVNWNVESAYHETTPTRERICLNGLWRWQLAEGNEGTVPATRWGFFKVPGSWPGISDYMQKDCQTLFAHPDWKQTRLGAITSAWYQREITVPANWTGRRIALKTDYVNSAAAVFIDGKKVGEILFPAGEMDLTSVCKPGSKHLLSMLVTALPLKAVMTAYTDTNAARQVRGSVARRGLCGDVWLSSEPQGPRITEVSVETSVRRGEITFSIAMNSISDSTHIVSALVRNATDSARRFNFPITRLRTSAPSKMTFMAKWKPDKLWDTISPQNQFTAQLSLIDSSGRTLDSSLPQKFGFREFWIDGRDFYLNGSRIWLSALPLDSAQVGAEWASYEGAKETLLRLKSFGINFVYTHNYDCEPGSHLSFSEILRAADDVGMLVALTQPHFSAYDWQAPNAEEKNGYARHAAFYCQVAASHPSVVVYATSHNACSYDEAKNPDLIDGIFDPRKDGWSSNNAKKALRAEAIIKTLDPSRIVYHHSSGNLGSMYTENFYVNFAPKQELDDWFKHWGTKGVKPLFLCEYGCPFSWDWAMYRGWYKGKREWGSANVPWELSIADWNAQFLGDKAYRISENEKRDLRWEAQQFRSGREGWHRWDYPVPIGSSDFEERNPVFAEYITDNYRSFRTWGVSATSPWEYEIWWRLRNGTDSRRKELPVDWNRLQQPGYSADYVDSRYDMMPYAFDRQDWTPTIAAQALIRNNSPLLAYIGGKPAKFTSKDHNFLPGETVEKQLIVINNSRRTVTCDCRWSLALPSPQSGTKTAPLTTGNQLRIPIKFALPPTLPAGQYKITSTVKFSTGEAQQDEFTIDVLPRPERVTTTAEARIGLFDPVGETAKLLSDLGIRTTPVQAGSDLSGLSLLIIGKKAITLTNDVPDLRMVRDGLKVIVFEQTAEVLEQRLGFRVTEYGLRNLVPRVAGHPLLVGLNEQSLHDWRGEATLSTPRLQYTLKPMYGPMVKWCGIDIPHVWRCGCQGNVASVLIEKPARGDFMPIVDGGYALQYSPLMVFHEGKGIAIFCQLDVTGRTEVEPAATRLVQNIVRLASRWERRPVRAAHYVGALNGASHLERCGFDLHNLPKNPSPSDSVLVLGPASNRGEMARFGGMILALGEQNGESVEHISLLRNNEAAFTFGEQSVFAGIGLSDSNCRDPQGISRLNPANGRTVIGDGGLAYEHPTVYCQLVPWTFDVQKPNQKRTFRRTSFLLTRLLCNLGVESKSQLLDDLVRPVSLGEKRWLDGLYLDTPEEWDDPYRFFPW